ncbi:S-adenosyl-L-methionine-dependent methyltransferases superfamily protein [Rhynchospora pubera]|uniref:S-adenosyl-L-methionine-dependent methyltransferases superfamily protein n=1 Tax=Rhynchospora pubera TaxID=906938 RepID=A0AAV8DWH9_9POAL|nr:S-adenosyl-L-methionine-dependent methyltransferases superfamily protein [Rhynchospora pubera]
MAGVFDKTAEQYAQRRPGYPKEWFSMLASLTPEHKVAWDAGSGSGQAAISVAEHYDQVIATDVSATQLKHAAEHPKVRYLHTPISTSEDELVSKLGGDNSIDLIISATAVHWFDLPFFYSVANRVLKKPHGIIAVWTYGIDMQHLKNSSKMLLEAVLPYSDPRTRHLLEGYKKLPFPFESVGYGSEGSPVELSMEIEMTLVEFVKSLKTVSAFVKAEEQGVELFSDEILKEMKKEWGGTTGRRKFSSISYMLVGKPKSDQSLASN